MPDYGVDTPDWSPQSWSWAAQRLYSNRNFWVVTVSPDSLPHASPVWGVWDDEPQFMFSCGPRSRKARNLADNRAVVVMTESTVECLSVEGVAQPLVDGARRDRWIELYLAKYRPIAPDLSADFIRANNTYEFSPTKAIAIVEREDEFANSATRWVFDA